MDQSYYVATGGDDNNPGSEREPYRTIDRAVLRVREIIASGAREPITVYIRGGRYERQTPLRFDERDSGTAESPVTYRAYPGEEVVITGGRTLTGWVRTNGNIWRAPLGEGRACSTLYADGKRVQQARLPAAGYYETDSLPEGLDDTRQQGIRFREGEAPPLAAAEEGLSVFVWPGEGEWNWFSETKAVAAYKAEDRYMTFRSPASWPIGEGSRFYLQGSLSFLRAPGQFHIDGNEGYVYYWPADGVADPSGQTVIVPETTRLLQIAGSRPEQPVTGLVFHGLTLSCTDFFPEYRMMEDNVEREEQRDGLVYLTNADSITIEQCKLVQSGSCGLFVDRSVKGLIAERNVISGFGHIGISLCGYAPGEGPFVGPRDADRNGHHRIADNVIEHGGELVGHGCGILMYQSGHNVITNNRISRMPRYGISMKGLRQGAMPPAIYGIPVTWDNHWDFLHTRDNLIAYNDISHVMEDSQDGGMIEAWGVGRGNVIHGNDLHDSGIHFSFGFGIYLDDAADDFTVTHNIIRGLYNTGSGKLWMLIFSKGIGNRIRNNLLVDNPMAIAAIGSQEMVGEANKHIEIASNIVYNSGYLYYFVNYDDQRFASADRNLYWKQGQPCRIAGELPLPSAGPDELDRDVYEWADWRSLADGRYDKSTVVAFPMFMDPLAGDYRLKPESPAYLLGWNDIAFGEIGPK
ncbi:MAG: right-handed parallel beta-helix repeat-containing protein [Paenibacillus sp.]|nr:right-handed parallel beta-helix repeat-containing protein [Paenibacillus sp.]